MKILGRTIGTENPPYIVAELSANHNGNLDAALRLIEEAAAAGADAVKIQTYRPDTITLKSETPDFQINDGIWQGRTLYDLYEWAHTPWEWHEALFLHAHKTGIAIFSSPFDATAVDFLESLRVPAYKIASFEIVDLPLIRYVASKGKPMIISTGMANLDEISDALAEARNGGCEDVALLRCVSGYPAKVADYNLSTLTDMAKRFDVPIGLSDHTLDNTTAVASVALGACLIEKHMTLNQDGGGPDDSFSLLPSEFGSLCMQARSAWEAIGTVGYDCKESERPNLKFRRSLYFTQDLVEGAIVTADVVKSVRPGYGLAPKNLDRIIGRSVNRNVSAATPVLWDVLT